MSAWARNILAGVVAVVLSVLAMLGVTAWLSERRRRQSIGKSAVDLANENARRAAELAKAEAEAAKAEASAAIAEDDAKQQEAVNVASNAGSDGLVDRIRTGG